jgi:hypothetical protein
MMCFGPDLIRIKQAFTGKPQNSWFPGVALSYETGIKTRGRKHSESEVHPYRQVRQ